MCGIVGHVGPRARALEGRLCSARDAMAHRGPDDAGLWTDDHAALGARRLSILDLSPSGHMPMASADGRHVLVFNGAIYNYVELRAELAREVRVPLQRRHGGHPPRLPRLGMGPAARPARRDVRLRASGTRASARCTRRATGWGRSRSSTPARRRALVRVHARRADAAPRRRAHRRRARARRVPHVSGRPRAARDVRGHGAAPAGARAALLPRHGRAARLALLGPALRAQARVGERDALDELDELARRRGGAAAAQRRPHRHAPLRRRGLEPRHRDREPGVRAARSTR